MASIAAVHFAILQSGLSHAKWRCPFRHPPSSEDEWNLGKTGTETGSEREVTVAGFGIPFKEARLVTVKSTNLL